MQHRAHFKPMLCKVLPGFNTAQSVEKVLDEHSKVDPHVAVVDSASWVTVPILDDLHEDRVSIRSIVDIQTSTRKAWTKISIVLGQFWHQR